MYENAPRGVCPVCGSNYTYMSNEDRYNNLEDYEGTYTIVRCGCGFEAGFRNDEEDPAIEKKVLDVWNRLSMDSTVNKNDTEVK